ncbi:hypothetical protein [Streptomyces nanshensis]|uniref:Uncharacterized protein n=1 Tax=Streptomyces nanshensis TaxID=518642 RepID=A0A1E7L2Y2_9ACTN|nr:hypothetical protein [Streptomyces nanshensis]OEV10555.1 hypothetical protein AN218_17000 [Streptomyces nanshensis]
MLVTVQILLIPPLTLLPSGVYAVSAMRRHWRLGPIPGRDEAWREWERSGLTLLYFVIITGLVLVLSLALNAPGAGLAWTSGVCLLGCLAGWRSGATTRWHQDGVCR